MTYKANNEYEIEYVSKDGSTKSIKITPENDLSTPAIIKEIQNKVDDFFKLAENKITESYKILESYDEDDEDEDDDYYDDELIGKDLFYMLEDFSGFDGVDPQQIKFITFCNTKLEINEDLSNVTDWMDDKRALKVVRAIQELSEDTFMDLVEECYGEEFAEWFTDYVDDTIDSKTLDTSKIDFVDLEESVEEPDGEFNFIDAVDVVEDETIESELPAEDQTETQLNVEQAISEVENPTQEEILAVNVTNSSIDVLIQDERAAISAYNEFLEQAKATILPGLIDVLETEINEIIRDEEDHIAKLETIKSAFHLDENPVETVEEEIIENDVAEPNSEDIVEEAKMLDDEDDVASIENEYQEAYHIELDMKSVPCVIARDKMLSGWGRADNTNHYQVVLCGSMDEAYQIEDAMQSKAKTEQLANIRRSCGVKTSSNGTVAYSIGRNAHAWNTLSDAWYEREFDNKEQVTESVEPQEIKVKSFDRYDNGMEVDIIIGQLEDGRYFEMLADTTTGISIFKQGFNPMTIEGKWILDGEESDNQELDNETLGNNTELSFEPQENKELWNTIVKDIDANLLLEKKQEIDVDTKAQELVDLCKKAYGENDLETAYKYWSEIYDLFLPPDAKEYNDMDSDERFRRFTQQQKYIDQFTDKEVYAITDFGRAKAYKEMGY